MALEGAVYPGKGCPKTAIKQIGQAHKFLGSYGFLATVTVYCW